MFKKIIQLITSVALLGCCIVGLWILQTQKNIIEQQNEALQPRMIGIVEKNATYYTTQPSFLTLEEKEIFEGVVESEAPFRVQTLIYGAQPVEYHKQPGDKVQVGDVLAEADAALLSNVRGRLVKITEQGAVASFELMDYDSLRVRAAVSPAAAATLRRDSPVELRYGADITFSGSVRDIAYTVNAQGLVDTVIDFYDEGCVTRLGAAMQAVLVIKTVENAMAVPLACVLKTAEGAYAVQVATPEGTYSLVTVEIGIRERNFVQITKGINAQSTVLVNPDKKYGTPLSREGEQP